MNFFKKLSFWYISKDALPYWCILAFDSAVLISLYILSIYLTEGGVGVIDSFWMKIGNCLFCMLFYWLGFKIFHTYANIIRYSSFIDLSNIAMANMVGALGCIIFRTIFLDEDTTTFPTIETILLATGLAMLFMGGSRVIVKTIYDNNSTNAEAINIFIYGIRNGGMALAKSIRNQKYSNFILKGFINPDSKTARGYLMGVPMLPENVKLVPYLIEHNIRGILISPLQMDHFRNNDRLINDLTENGIKIFMMPPAQEWNGKDELNHQNLRSVSIEDLLPRQQIEIDIHAIAEQLMGKKILITGAAGSIGSEIVKQVASFKPSSLILVDIAETPMHSLRLFMANEHSDIDCHTIVGSITNKPHMEKIFKEQAPDYIFHAAAYKHVPMMEDNPTEAVQNNIYGTRVIADLAVKYQVKKFVMISTDKAVNPTNVMGCSKRICEIYVQSLDQAIKDGKVEGVTQFVTTRFGNVLGSNGSVIPIFKEQIRKGGPITVTHPDIIRYFMLIPEACKLVLQAGVFGNGGEIYIFDMGNPVRIADLAKRMIALSNAPHVKIEYIGLRDGEKLYEELLNNAEHTLPTKHPKIRIAQTRQYQYETALKNEERLFDCSLTGTDMEIVKIMKDIVPEFISKQSKYDVLDNR